MRGDVATWRAASASVVDAKPPCDRDRAAGCTRADGDAAADGIYVFEDERSDGYHPYSVVNDRLKADCPQQGHGRDGLQCRTAIYHYDPDDGYGLSVLKFGAGFQFSGAPTMLSCCCVLLVAHQSRLHVVSLEAV